MNSTLSLVAFVISCIALYISVKNYIRINHLKEHTAKTHLLIDDLLITTKVILKTNKEFLDKIIVEEKNDRHTVRSNRVTKKTRRTSDK